MKTSEERKSTCTKHTMFEKVHQILFFSKPLRPGAKVTLQRIPKAKVNPIKANAALVACLLELTEAAAGHIYHLLIALALILLARAMHAPPSTCAKKAHIVLRIRIVKMRAKGQTIWTCW